MPDGEKGVRCALTSKERKPTNMLSRSARSVLTRKSIEARAFIACISASRSGPNARSSSASSHCGYSPRTWRGGSPGEDEAIARLSSSVSAAGP